jgi:hypothetical protein
MTESDKILLDRIKYLEEHQSTNVDLINRSRIEKLESRLDKLEKPNYSPPHTPVHISMDRIKYLEEHQPTNVDRIILNLRNTMNTIEKRVDEMYISQGHVLNGIADILEKLEKSGHCDSS